MWCLALATQAALTVLYGWLFTWMAVAPSPEGMASFAALVVGPVAVAIPVIGLIALLLPSARAAALGSQSHTSHP
jgi:fumarate reductase subunit C